LQLFFGDLQLGGSLAEFYTLTIDRRGHPRATDVVAISEVEKHGGRGGSHWRRLDSLLILHFESPQ